MCLKEELRGLKNGNSSSWGRKVREALREVGDGETLDWIHEEVEKNLGKGLKIKKDQEIQKNWSRIGKSKYCKFYGAWKLEERCGKRKILG